MFEWVDKHKRWIQVVLLLLIVPSFAFLGINYYFQEYGGGDAVAEVAGTRISPQEFEQALRERQEQLKQAMQGKVDQAMLDSNEVRNAVINGLVEKRALLAYALHAGMTVSDEELTRVIREIPVFTDEATGKFSAERYKLLLQGQGMSPAMFEERVRQDLRIAQVRDSVVESTVLPRAVAERLGRIRGEQREVAQWVLTPEQVRGQVKVGAEDVKRYYDEHQAEFTIPDRVRVEYVLLTQEAVSGRVEVTPQEVAAYYQDHLSQYRKPEERKASHILIGVPKEATAEAKAQARKKAEDILAELRASPKAFADLARKHSEDPGSAQAGGDLGFFARGAMVKQFDDAVFGMQAGDIAGPVETEYGFHLIRLDAIKQGEATPLDKVRAEIEEELKKQKAGKLFAEAADTLQNVTYEQSESLKPAADALGLPVQTSDWITRSGAGMPLLTKPELLGKIFSEESIKGRRNIDPVEVSSNTLVAARVIDYQPASAIPFEEVRRDVEQQLTLERAVKVVEEQGLATLERVRKGDVKDVRWSPANLVSLQQPGGLHPEAARAVFGADTSTLPQYVGMAVSGGRYVIYRISRVIEAPALDERERKELSRQLAQLAAQEQLDAYAKAVKAAAGVQINTSRVEKRVQ
jgi:peptidyl-prolyl cis-trans isomerase D